MPDSQKSYLISHSVAENIPWATTDLWRCKFESCVLYGKDPSPPPAPFQNWIPAFEIEYPETSISSFPIDAPMMASAVKIPTGGGVAPGTATVTVYDDENFALTDWIIYHWITGTILNSNGLGGSNGSGGISPILSPGVLKWLYVWRSTNKQLSQKSGGKVTRMLVYPEGAWAYKGVDKRAIFKIYTYFNSKQLLTTPEVSYIHYSLFMRYKYWKCTGKMSV
jgi:hypothetical protein